MVTNKAVPMSSIYILKNRALSLSSDVFINFMGDIPPGALGPTYVVLEDNGMVTVCLSTSTGTVRDIVIEVTPEEKSVANAASKLTIHIWQCMLLHSITCSIHDYDGGLMYCDLTK